MDDDCKVRDRVAHQGLEGTVYRVLRLADRTLVYVLLDVGERKAVDARELRLVHAVGGFGVGEA